MSVRKKKIGNLNFQRPDKKVMTKWKSYRFEINANYFFYCKADNVHKPDGMVLLGSITKLETNAVKNTTYPLQVHFSGKPQAGHASSPWVLDLASNEERMEWMECLVPGSSKDLQIFSRSNSRHRSLSSSEQSVLPGIAAVGSSSEGAGYGTVTPPPQDYLDFAPVNSQSRQVDTLNNSGRYAQAPQRPPQTVGSASAGSQDNSFRVTSNGGNHGVTTGQNSGSACHSQSNLRQDPHRHTYSNGRSRIVDQKMRRSNTGLPTKPPPSDGKPQIAPRHAPTGGTRISDGSKPQAAPRLSSISSTQQALPRVPYGDKSPNGGREKSISPVSHLYEMDDFNDVLDEVARPKRSDLVRQPQATSCSGALHKSMSYDKEGEFAPMDGKEGEFDDRYDIPTKPVPAARQSINTNYKPVAPPRKKKPIQHEYLELTPTHENTGCTEEQRRDKYLKDLGDVGLNPQVRNFSADQLNKFISMLQENQPDVGYSQGSGSHSKAEPLNYVESLSTYKMLLTDEDGEDSYEPRPDWAKAMGNESSKKPSQSLSQCDALLDLQEEALYIARSAVDNFKEIGEGQFGKVFRAQMQRGKSQPIIVAVKTAKKSTTEKDKDEFLREMNIMSLMRHPNIVQLHGIIRDDVPAPWIVLEFLKNGDLKNFLIKNQRPVETLVKYMIDIAMGMHYLSEKGLVHRDLAARNVLVGEDETCKVSDFGLLRKIPRDDSIYHMNTSVPCPVRWMAPESIEQREFSLASDVWSFGILQWEMFHPKNTPYQTLGNIEVAMKVMKGYRLETPLDCPSVVSRIMKACWHQVPEKRPSFLLITTLLSTKV